MLSVALIGGIIAAAVLGTGGLPIEIPIGLGVLYFALPIYSDYSAKVNVLTSREAGGFFLLVGAPFFPLSEMIYKITDLKNKIEQQENRLNTELDSIKTFFTSINLPKLYSRQPSLPLF